MENPLVSVITSCFRGERYLKVFLENLPKQTIFDRVELVLDHNEPSPVELGWVEAFKAAYPEHLRYSATSPVRPYGASINACIRAARGKYSAIWNVDDVRTPISLEAQVRALEGSPHAAAACGPYGMTETFSPTPRFSTALKGMSDPSRLSLKEFYRSMVLGSFFMFRTDWFQRTGPYDEQFLASADFDFALRLLRLGPPVFTEERLGFFLSAGTGLSTRSDSVGPVEDQAIHLRYGLWDKIVLDHLPEVLKYDVANILDGGKKLPVSSFFPGFDEEMQRRRALLFPVFLQRHQRRPRGRISRWFRKVNGVLRRCRVKLGLKKEW